MLKCSRSLRATVIRTRSDWRQRSGEAAEFPWRCSHGFRVVIDVELDNFGAYYGSGVGHGDVGGEGQRVVVDIEGCHHGIGVREGRVGKAVAEGIVHSDGSRIVVAVADVDALAVPYVAVLAGKVEKRRGIGEPDRDRLGKLAGRVTSPSRTSAMVSPCA